VSARAGEGRPVGFRVSRRRDLEVPEVGADEVGVAADLHRHRLSHLSTAASPGDATEYGGCGEEQPDDVVAAAGEEESDHRDSGGEVSSWWARQRAEWEAASSSLPCRGEHRGRCLGAGRVAGRRRLWGGVGWGCAGWGRRGRCGRGLGWRPGGRRRLQAVGGRKEGSRREEEVEERRGGRLANPI
jgi:hypothetical protein